MNSIVFDIVSLQVPKNEIYDIAEVTPVNTIERNSGQLRRSMSKTSSTSSSSGCLSDRCSSGGSQEPPNHPMGFESDFPMGGTIKKRPSAIANVKVRRKKLHSYCLIGIHLYIQS